jgi:hypothetical protein
MKQTILVQTTLHVDDSYLIKFINGAPAVT